MNRAHVVEILGLDGYVRWIAVWGLSNASRWRSGQLLRVSSWLPSSVGQTIISPLMVSILMDLDIEMAVEVLDGVGILRSRCVFC